MRYLTAGESHGEALVGILEGLPAGLKVDIDFINDMLKARQNVYGRGSRSSVCRDEARIIAGLNDGVTTGAPLAVMLNNGNCGNKGNFDFYRPGHADYAANIKYGLGDAALGAERASARETAMRTALGAVAIGLLKELGIQVTAYVTQIGQAKANEGPLDEKMMCDVSSVESLKAVLDEAERTGDTLGGKLKLTISGVKAGIGSHVFYDRRLDYRLGGALMAIPAVKAVESGLGCDFAYSLGSRVADSFVNTGGKISRTSNNCGGIEGGISNGEDIIFTLTVKPIPSIAGLKTVDSCGNECVTGKVRGDVCAVPAACIVAEAVAALELAGAIMDTLGGDNMNELIERYKQKGEL
ncbi:MAG: chorismate synthase [Clostridiales bacterium]|nr:chorismate synthase [Clostridiales bacterium]